MASEKRSQGRDELAQGKDKRPGGEVDGRGDQGPGVCSHICGKQVPQAVDTIHANLIPSSGTT